MTYILHLSDLYFGTDKNAQDRCNRLVQDLNSDDLNCNSLDALVLSGDITKHAVEEEYDEAVFFLDLLGVSLGLKPSQVVIVPGNHDINWDKEDQQRFGCFKDFYETVKGESYNLDYENQYNIDYLHEQNLLILGLNSAWKLSKFETRNADINSKALDSALEEVKKFEEVLKNKSDQDCLKIQYCLKIAV